MSPEGRPEPEAGEQEAFRPVRVAPPGPLWVRRRERRRGRLLDRVVGISLGIVLGVGIVTAFVFLGSEDTIDAPRVASGDSAERTTPAEPGPAGGGATGGGSAVPVVEVAGGAPPASGPAELEARRGERVRFRVRTDAPVALEVAAFGVAETVEDGSVVSFRAARAGQFPVVVAASQIAVATLRITP